jgi:predicted nucleotidyltransferase
MIMNPRKRKAWDKIYRYAFYEKKLKVEQAEKFLRDSFDHFCRTGEFLEIEDNVEFILNPVEKMVEFFDEAEVNLSVNEHIHTVESEEAVEEVQNIHDSRDESEIDFGDVESLKTTNDKTQLNFNPPTRGRKKSK